VQEATVLVDVKIYKQII